MQALRYVQQLLKAGWAVKEPPTLHPQLEESSITPTNSLEERHPPTPVSSRKARFVKHAGSTSGAFKYLSRRPPRSMASTSERASAHYEEEKQTTTLSNTTRTTATPRPESPWQDVSPSPTTTHANIGNVESGKVEREGKESATPARTPKSKRTRKARSVLSHLRKHGTSMVLQNSGSVARDHLASERTFLAYVRTSLALASMGVALVQLFTIAELTSNLTHLPSDTERVQRFARPLGITTVALSLIVLAIGVYRYFVVQYALPEGKFPIARFSVAFTSFVFTSIVVVIFGALLSSRGG